MTMRLKLPRLNNRKLQALRQSIEYEAVMTDLFLIGALERDVVETLTGRKIGDFLVNPVSGLPLGAEAEGVGTVEVS